MRTATPKYRVYRVCLGNLMLHSSLTLRCREIKIYFSNKYFSANYVTFFVSILIAFNLVLNGI